MEDDKMQASQGKVILVVVACAVVLLVAMFLARPASVDPAIIPTAEEIAALVVIPAVADTSSQEQREIWENVHRGRIRTLENQALRECAREYDDALEDLFGDYVNVRFVREFEDDREWTYVDIGLDDEDDRNIIVDGKIKVRIDNDYNEMVFGTCTVTSDHGDLEADLILSL